MANARLGWFSPLGLAASIRASAFRFGDSPRRVGLRTHGFRFSARTDSGLPLGGLAFGFTASAFRHAPLRRLPLGELAFGLTASAFRHAPFRRLPLGGLAFGLTASAFRHAPLRSGCWASSFFRLPLRSCGSAGWPSDSLLPLFGLRRFGDCPRRAASSAFRFGDCRWVGWPSGSPLPLFGLRRFGDCPRRVGLRAHRFRFSARTASELPSAGWPRAHCFRFSACPASEIALGGLVLPLGGLAFGLTASAFRYAPLRSGRWASWPSGSRLPLFGMRCFGVAAGRVGSSAFRFGVAVRRVGLRAHCFRFSARIDSEWLLGEFVLPPSASEIPLGGLVLPLGGWPSGSLLPLFGTRRSAPPHRRSEDRRSTTTRQLFHFKTLIPTC